MPLDPRLQIIADQMAAQGAAAPMTEATPQQMREMYEGMRAMDGAGEECATVEDTVIGDIPVRVYKPVGEPPFPIVVFFHGGGWVIGSLNTHDGRARALANAAGAVVVSVDYRLAPEHKFPCAAEDAYAATVWTAEEAASIGGDASRLALVGDSAGANLVAAVALMARDRGGPAISAQVMVYPVTNYAFDTPSYAENGQGYLLSIDSMKWFWGHYLTSEEDGANPYASPMRAQSLEGLPPALVITAEFDPLRDEGEAYAKRLSESGVPVVSSRFDGMMHGFFQMSALVPDEVRRATDQIVQQLQTSFTQAKV